MRCAEAEKFSASLAVWKPSRSADSRSRMNRAASGTLDSMSGLGNGVCRKKPIGQVTLRARMAAAIAIRW